MQVSPVLDLFLQGKWRQELLHTASQARQELGTLTEAELARCGLGTDAAWDRAAMAVQLRQAFTCHAFCIEQHLFFMGLCRTLVNTWLLLGIAGLWTSMGCLHPAARARAPRRAFSDYITADISDMSLENIFKQDIANKS
jgi:hypothetical protein